LLAKNDARGHKSAWLDLYPLLALLVAFVVLPITHQGLALARHAAVAWHTADPIVAWPRELDGFVIEDPGLGQLLALPEGKAIGEAIRDGKFEAVRRYLPPLQEIFQVEYLVTVKDGIETLQRLAPAGKSVIVLDFSNPFSFSLHLPPPRGDALFNDIGRTQSRGHPIPAAAYFASATFVMIPHVPVSVSARDYLMSTYADHLARYFHPVAESRYWTVLRRQGATS
jgi:hypothetical protein